MKYDFIVLGADGIQGLIVSRYLLRKGYRLFLADQYRTKIKTISARYKKNAKFSYIDLRQENKIVKLLRRIKAPVVINCADMYWNVNVYRACLKTKRHCVDLGSWIELTAQQLRMDRDFMNIKRTAITGCGSVPGIGNVMLAYASSQLDKVESVDVGFSWASNMEKFVVPFSMKSILEEFTYSPRYLKAGKWIQAAPLSVILARKFRSIGYQKTFLVQHPELYTFYKYYKNKGLKNVRFFAGFPKHSLHRIYSLIDLGFHSDKPVKLEGVRVAPFDMLLPVLKRLPIPKGYQETENLWVEIKGGAGTKNKVILMECIVPPRPSWYEYGCNIDTGFPAAIISEMIADGRIATSGSFAPEAVVPPEPFFQELRKNGMKVYQSGRLIN